MGMDRTFHQIFDNTKFGHFITDMIMDRTFH